ncbi:hypothetical protein E4U59_003119 [Claviceps monticola]|nr:hypothetical protein E4U59_003119 [Claviceps monticola]
MPLGLSVLMDAMRVHRHSDEHLGGEVLDWSKPGTVAADLAIAIKLCNTHCMTRHCFTLDLAPIVSSMVKGR